VDDQARHDGVAQPQNRFAATLSGSYLIARPTIHFGGAGSEADRKVKADAFRLSAGVGVKVFDGALWNL
jgi:hypothetical protein